jgi:arylsulfatase A-like enzyme
VSPARIKLVRPASPLGAFRTFLRTALPLFLATHTSHGAAVADRNAPPSKPNLIVILTDDLGYADLGIQGQERDVRTPHLDRLAAEGVRCTAGYVTAPQCSPSRAGLLTGRYQQRYGIDTIPDMPLPLEAVTIPERLKASGYLSGQVGKWHLEPNALTLAWGAKNIPDQKPIAGRITIPETHRQRFFPRAQGFDDYFCGEINRYYSNYDLTGAGVAPGWREDKRFRVDVQTDAALAFLRRHHTQPFFLYLCYFAPHTPLELPPAYTAQFSPDLPLRRRAALAMIAGVDHGVGRILAALKSYGIDDNTLIFFTSDNGAPIHTRRDSPLDRDMGGWDGSLNTPLVGEKGMLSEGGIRVPFLARWPKKFPAGQVYNEPVSTLDLAATANALAGLPADPQLDGVNLIPHLSGQASRPPHAALYWRFWSQAAVREGRWKLLHKAGESDRLFDLATDEHEHRDLAAAQPDRVAALRRQLVTWTDQLQPRGLPTDRHNAEERVWYRDYFSSRPTPSPSL